MNPKIRRQYPVVPYISLQRSGTLFNSQRCWDQVMMFESTFVFVQPGVVDYQDSKNEKVSEFRPFQTEKPWSLSSKRSSHGSCKTPGFKPGLPWPICTWRTWQLERHWQILSGICRSRVKFMNSQNWIFFLLLHVITRLWAWQAKLLNIRHCLYYQRLKESCP